MTFDIRPRIIVGQCPNPSLNHHWICMLTRLKETGHLVRYLCNTVESVLLSRNGPVGVNACRVDSKLLHRTWVEGECIFCSGRHVLMATRRDKIRAGFDNYTKPLAD